MVQLGGFCGTFKGVLSTHLGFFSAFGLVFVGRFLGVFLASSGNEWGVGTQAGCQVHPENRPPTPPVVCPGLLVVHLGGLFGQISGLEVGEVMEGHRSTFDCALRVLLHIALCMRVAGEHG